MIVTTYFMNQTSTTHSVDTGLGLFKPFGNCHFPSNTKYSVILYASGSFYGRERIGESNYHDSQGEFWPKLKQCLTDWTKEALPQSFRTRAF